MDTSLKSAECPVCLEYMSTPIFLCQTGHSYCAKCKNQILVCALCQKYLTIQRNFTLESVLCELTLLKNKDNDIHDTTIENVPVTCPQERCLFKTEDYKNLVPHLKEKHQSVLKINDLGMFHVLLENVSFIKGTKYVSKILIYNEEVYRVLIKFDPFLTNVRCAVQIVNFRQSNLHKFEIDYMRCIRKHKYCGNVGKVTTRSQAFSSKKLYAEIPKQICSTTHDEIVIYGRVIIN